MEYDRSQFATLGAHAARRHGTREAIERLGLRDFADLVIALARSDLDLPKPADAPARAARVARASEILQPLLHHGG